MSPSERDLRNALRHGEGDRLDVDGIVAGARARQHQRRVRMASGAAAVVVVAAAATGGTLLANGGGHGHPSASQRSTGPTIHPGANFSTHSNGNGLLQSSASTRSAGPGNEKVVCPATFPTTTGNNGSAATLFAEPVVNAVVCAYGTSPGVANTDRPTITETTIDGSTATQLASSLEDAAKTRPSGMCPTLRLAAARRFAIYGLTASGAMEPVVTTTTLTPTCAVVVTNGAAVRYAWSPPTALARTFAPTIGR